MDRDSGKDEARDASWVEIPPERLAPQTLRRLLEEFVSRDGADWGETGGSLDEKVTQVREQLRRGLIRIVFDLETETANLLPAEPGKSFTDQNNGDEL